MAAPDVETVSSFSYSYCQWLINMHNTRPVSNEEPTIRRNHSLGLVPEQLHSVRLLDHRIDDLLSGEEVPHAASVELISKWVEEGIEDGVRLCHNWKHLRTETKSCIMCKVVQSCGKLELSCQWPFIWLPSILFFTILTVFSYKMLDLFKRNKRSPFLVLETRPWRSRSRRRCTWGRRGPSTSAWPSRAYWC